MASPVLVCSVRGTAMIDVHTHPCNLRDQATYDYFEQNGEIPQAVLESYLQAISDVDKAVVLALWAPASGIETSNALVTAVVRQDPSKLIGFASIDPKAPTATLELEKAIKERGLRGVKLAPIYQHFAPDDPGLWPLYEKIQELGVPIMWHQGTSFLMPDGPLEEARPFLLDKVARAFPELKMVIAHFGYPWPGEVIALLRKHPNVHTDISVLAGRPWFLYNALVGALEYGAVDKILLGSDYPAFTAGETVSALKHINDFARGTSLPSIPETVINEIIERDSLALLGIT
jgi:predicted TIM-barrel fold metal-dependent hydrolase